MKEIEVEFYVQTWKVGSTIEATKVFEVEEDATEKEIEAIIDEAWKEWIWNNIEAGYEIKS